MAFRRTTQFPELTLGKYAYIMRHSSLAKKFQLICIHFRHFYQYSQQCRKRPHHESLPHLTPCHENIYPRFRKDPPPPPQKSKSCNAKAYRPPTCRQNYDPKTIAIQHNSVFIDGTKHAYKLNSRYHPMRLTKYVRQISFLLNRTVICNQTEYPCINPSWARQPLLGC